MRMHILYKLEEIELCTNKACDHGWVVTDKVTAEGRFMLGVCEVCLGLGFKPKEEEE